MDYRETISLQELELRLPPLTDHEKKRHITYRKDGAEEKTSNIIIVGRAMFTFLFCFTNHYNKHNPLTNALKAEPHYGRLDRPAVDWLPPHWVVFPVRETTSTYRLTSLSWDSNYRQRFSDTDKTKREEIRDRLIKRSRECRQGSFLD